MFKSWIFFFEKMKFKKTPQVWLNFGLLTTNFAPMSPFVASIVKYYDYFKRNLSWIHTYSKTIFKIWRAISPERYYIPDSGFHDSISWSFSVELVDFQAALHVRLEFTIWLIPQCQFSEVLGFKKFQKIQKTLKIRYESNSCSRVPN